ncbi:MAG: hypothetical protein QOC88_3557, partial [Mycobacterium sp.]|nr:hypothetical protein [Mycobacterium sp.]
MLKARGGMLLVAVLGALVAAAATATAPVVRADDPLTDLLVAVQGDFALGQEAFTLANADFANGDVADGLATFYGGVDDI